MATSTPAAQTQARVIQRRERRSRPGLDHTSANTKSRAASVSGVVGGCMGEPTTSWNVLAARAARSEASVMGAASDGDLAADLGAQHVDRSEAFVRLEVPVCPAVAGRRRLHQRAD